MDILIPSTRQSRPSRDGFAVFAGQGGIITTPPEVTT